MQPAPYRNVAAELTALDVKVNALLPPRYQHCYTSVSPDSMGSAGLRYGLDGKVAWDEVWTTFCDLALAGGPPHRGELLEPVSEAELAASPERTKNVVAEITRAIGLTTGLGVVGGYEPGWIGVRCDSLEEAAWLQLAINAENVSARRRQSILQLPAGPAFRVEKEIKNIVVGLAKTSHYWDGHLTASQQSLAGAGVWEAATPAEAAANPAPYETALGELESILRAAEIPTSPHRYIGWIGVQADSEESAVWMLRAVLVEQVLARREGRLLYVAVGASSQAGEAARTGLALRQAWELRAASAPHRPAWRPFGASR